MASPAIPDHVALLAGPQLLGHLFNFGLFGVLVTQVYIYHLSFPTDSKYIKSYVYILFCIECLQVIMATHDAFKVFGSGWGDINALNDAQWLWFDTPVLSGMVSASVQCFFAWRIYLLSRSIYLAVFIAMVALAQGSSAMANGIIVHTADLRNSVIQERTSAVCTVWLGGSAVCDTIIAVSMLYFLSRGKRGLASDAMLSRLIRLTVETGTLTATVACVDLILFLLFKHNNLHMAPALVLSKLYSNTLMMLFNNRTQLRNLKAGFQASGGRIWISTRSEVETTVDSGGHTTINSHSATPQQFALKKLHQADCDGSTTAPASSYLRSDTQKTHHIEDIDV